MMDLDNVIKAADICKDVIGCQKCPYYDRKNKIMGCMDKNHGKNIFLEDVTVYLKKYLLLHNLIEEH